MEELVFRNSKGTAVTSSLLVAQKFGKRHADIIRIIGVIIKQSPEHQSQRNFALSEYQDVSGKSNPLYIITRDGFSILVMGFTGENAMQFKWDFIEAFNRMETTLQEYIPKMEARFCDIDRKLESLLTQIESEVYELLSQRVCEHYYKGFGNQNSKKN
jgi:Rha family phage regulatory protein